MSIERGTRIIKMAALGYACLCIGLILLIYGKASDNLTVDLVGGRVRARICIATYYAYNELSLLVGESL